jgi:hypothetical protein
LGPENALLGVELDPVGPEVRKGPLQVLDQVVGLPGLDHDVVYVDLDDLSDEVIETLLHAALVCQPDIFEAERHCHIAVHAKRSDE